MGNLAETVKKQTDRILRQRALNRTEGVVVSGVSSGTGAPAPVVNSPAADLTAHKSSADHDGRYYTEDEVDGLLNFVGLSDTPAAYTGEGGKIVAVKADVSGLEFVAAPAATNGIPTGGTNNQLLAKDGAADYVVKWVDAPEAANGLPAGGTVGQVLQKKSGTDYDIEWVDSPSAQVFIFDETITTEGVDKTSTSNGSFSSMTALLDVFLPVKITAIYWDIFAAGTYTMKINGNQVAQVVVSTAPQSDVEFTFSTPILLVPGLNEIHLDFSTAVRIYFKSGTNYAFTYYRTLISKTDGADNSITMPIKIEGYVGRWNTAIF